MRQARRKDDRHRTKQLEGCATGRPTLPEIHGTVVARAKPCAWAAVPVWQQEAVAQFPVVFAEASARPPPPKHMGGRTPIDLARRVPLRQQLGHFGPQMPAGRPPTFAQHDPQVRGLRDCNRRSLRAAPGPRHQWRLLQLRMEVRLTRQEGFLAGCSVSADSPGSAAWQLLKRPPRFKGCTLTRAERAQRAQRSEIQTSCSTCPASANRLLLGEPSTWPTCTFRSTNEPGLT